MTKVSVIIPVYNVEKYIPECLDSVLNQTFKDIEIICINDCSTDGSFNILKKYAQKDKRIRVIDFLKNQGVSIARNTGIEEASGDYIAFLDPDDWWELYLIEKAINKIQKDNTDIVLFCHNEFINNELVPKVEKIAEIQDIINGADFTKYIYNVAILAWDKLYKAELLKNERIRFTEHLHPTEDVIFALEVFSKKPKVSYMTKCFYNYRIKRKGSAMNNYCRLITNQIEALKILLNLKFYKEADDEYKMHCVKLIYGGVVYFYMNFKEQHQLTLKDHIEVRKLFHYMNKNIPANILEHINTYKFLQCMTTLHRMNGVNCLKEKKLNE